VCVGVRERERERERERVCVKMGNHERIIFTHGHRALTLIAHSFYVTSVGRTRKEKNKKNQHALTLGVHYPRQLKKEKRIEKRVGGGRERDLMTLRSRRVIRSRRSFRGPGHMSSELDIIRRGNRKKKKENRKAPL